MNFSCFFGFLLLLTLPPATGGAQPAPAFDWQFFGPAQGMGMSFNVIRQDSRGFLWLGSTNGLYRYDGAGFRFHKKWLSEGAPVSSDWIWDLAEDAGGDLWIATYNGGLNRWRRRADTIEHFRHLPGDAHSLSGDGVLHLTFDGEGKLWMVVQSPAGRPVLNRLDPRDGRVTRFSAAQGLAGGPIHIAGHPAANIHPVACDQEGGIWVATQQGLFHYVRREDRFVPVALDGAGEGALRILNIYPSPIDSNALWISAAAPGRPGGLLFRVDRRAGRGRLVHRSEQPVFSLWQSPGRPDELWFTSQALHRLHLPGGEVTSFPVSFGEVPLSLTAGPDGRLWMHALGIPPGRQERGTDNYGGARGVAVFEPAGETVHRIVQPPGQEPLMAVHTITADRSGNLWLGAYTGFYKMKPPAAERTNLPQFTHYQLPPAVDRDHSTHVRAVVEESDSILWFGAFNGGLHRLDRRSGKLTSWRHDPARPGALRHDNVYSLYFEPRRRELWVGHEAGIDRLALDGFSPKARFRPLTDRAGRLDSRINVLAPDGQGRLWAGTGDQGLLLLDPATGAVLRQYLPADDQGLPDAFINAVFTDSRGHTWVAPNMGGACRLTGSGDSTRFDCRFDGLYIVDFHEAPDGKLWMAAMNYGLVVYDPATEDYDLLTMENRLLRNSVTGIEADSLGRIWFTSLGLGRYDPEKDSYQFFGREAGIRELDPERCFHRDRQGHLWYFSINGDLQRFDPQAVRDNPVAPQVALTAFRLFNGRTLRPGQGDVLTESIETAGEIRLSHRQHSFTLGFAGLEFTEPEKNQYRYRLAGVDPGWVYAGSRREARYNNVPPGRYTFQVEAANSDGVWSEQPAQLTVVVRQAWWKTTVAYLGYLLAGGALTYLLLRGLQHRWRLQAELDLERREAERWKELDALKTRLYTNITHEFRTPLTVILGNAGQLLSHYRQRAGQKLEDGVDSIRRNANSLLFLVNQLLDLSKAEAGELKAHYGQGDIVPFLKQVFEGFRDLAAQKNIELQFLAATPSFTMDYDPDKMEKIVANLLSNALKFTPENGRVTLRLDRLPASSRTGAPEQFLLEVSDTGVGIAPGHLPHIFDRFYQAEQDSTRRWEGTGIGLTLTRELTDLLGGTIDVSSWPGAGSTFTVELPVSRQAPPLPAATRPQVQAPAESGGMPSEAAGGREQNAPHPLLLIVEDNRDVARFLQGCLEDNYQVATVHNGAEGIETARDLVPDLIISDIMMPGADGYELCRTLKGDERTSHIPIVLFTARTEEAARLTGLQHGADAYLPKPSPTDELLLVVHNLIELRRRLQRRYAQLTPPADEPPTPEDRFIAKARLAVERQLNNPDFGVEQLAEALHLSRSQLYRKLTFLTGASASDFIRTIKMQRAEVLLKEGDLTIAEIAYALGYRDPSYFTRVFSQTFGYPPREARS